MIYGLNFGAPDIPDAIRRKFSRRVKVDGRFYMLVGVCTERAELDAMIVQATNGTRLLHTVEKKTAGAPFYGVYAH